jgi:hypothetical protein
MFSFDRVHLLQLCALFALETAVANAEDLQNFNDMLVGPISEAFGAKNSLNDTIMFYKTLFNEGWHHLICLESNNSCSYVQVASILFQLFSYSIVSFLSHI